MGRAKGDPNRSKSRPSSSSLAASHLQTPGAAPLGFGGYVGSSLVETEVSLDVDGEVGVHLKRLSKRDSTTKLKALTALRGIFKEHSVEDLAPILMQWVFEYKRLVQDNNRQVRESAHNAMADLTTNTGRGLAPHLRSLMGAWWVAQFDPSREVAEAAQNSLQATFQERKKRVDALVYCLKDIINYVDENLKLTPQILIELGTPSEEVAEKLERILSSSLLALAALLDVLVGSTSSIWREGPAERISLTSTAVGAGEAVKEAATSLFHKHKSLQSSVKNRSSQVRSAGYQALRTYIQHIPQVFTDQENLEDSVKLVFGSLGDKATSCHQPMWEMILLFAKRFPQAWGCTCIRKAVLPKLWDFLRHGCFGSQEFSYPCIFPLIALIPPEFVAPPEGFFLEFFSSLWRGMNSLASVKDRLALLTTLQECFVWVVNNAKRFAMDKASKELQDFLVEEVLLKMVWYCYLGVLDQESVPATVVRKDGHMALSQETSIEVVGVIVDIMVLLGQEDNLLDVFWPGFQSTGLKILRETSTKNDAHLTRLAEFFSLLERKTNQTERKQIVWPVRDAVQPFVAKAFPAIKSSGSSEAIRMLGQLISSYGTSTFASTEMAVREGTEQLFQKEVVPWCLTPGNSELSASKVDLLLAFFDIKEFQQFWSSTLEQATAWVRPGEKYRELLEEDIKQVEVLAILVEKFSERWVEADMLGKSRSIEPWRLSKLDAVGLTLTSSNCLSHPSCLRLLRNLLGAKYPEMKSSRLLTPDAAVYILQQLLQRLLDVLSLHELPYIQTAPSYILLGEANEALSNVPVDDSERAKRFELARATLEVVGVFSCSSVYVEYEHIGSQLLSAIFCMYWALLEPVPRKKSDEDHDESEDDMTDDDVQDVTSSSFIGYVNTVGLGLPSCPLDILLERSQISLKTYLQAMRKNMSPAVCQELSTVSRAQIRSILLEIARSTLFEGDFPHAVLITNLCATWVHDVVEYLCVGDKEIQETITLALASNPAWSLWADVNASKDELIPIILPLKSTTLDKEELQKKFCAFADVLATYLEPTTVYAGCPSIADDIPSSSFNRVWLIVELLCTWEWPGGAAPITLVKFLCEVARNAKGQKIPHLLRICIQSLFEGSSLFSSNQVQEGVEDCSLLESDPYMNALLMLLRALLWDEGAWGHSEAYQFFFEYVSQSSAEAKTSMCSLNVLPAVLPILMPIMRQQASETSAGFREGQSLKQDVSAWLSKALSYPPINSCEGVHVEWERKQWLQVAIACYPLLLPGVTSGMVAASQAKVSLLETSLLFKLMKKQCIVSPVQDEPQLSSAEPTLLVHQELTLAKLISVSVAYCWQEFGVDEWTFVLGHLRKWIDSAVVEFEEMTENIVEFFKNGLKDTFLDLQELSGRKFLIELAATTISIFTLVKDLNKMESVPARRTLGNLRQSNWEALEDHMMDQILRILLATGLSESAVMESNVEDDEAAKLIAKHRVAESFFWESIAEVALEATPRAREAAVRAADLWGVGKGSISALYALLFSSNSNRSLQWVAFQFLSEEPLQQLAVTCGGGISPNQTVAEDGAPQEAENEEVSLAAAAKIRPELSKVLETPATLLQSSLTSTVRMHYFLGCSIFLMRLQALPPLSPTRERLLQFAQDSNTPSTLLDCLFQHIPLDLNSGTSASRRRAAVVGAKINVAAISATRAVSSGSVSFAVDKSLRTLKENNLAGVAGAIYGLLLRVLPACVRIWFTGLRDRSTATAIENFTTTNCSSHLLADEFSQLQKSVVADDTLSIRANRTLREVIALYKKEEAGLDIVIRLPSCYPLRAVDVDCTRRLGISETLLRKWILSMASFLRNQNGAILEAVHMWKKNVDREFEGVEECPICYSIIHTTNHSLPRLACKTCKHKFHSACLYKWFSTSHKSTCPLCQTPF